MEEISLVSSFNGSDVHHVPSSSSYLLHYNFSLLSLCEGRKFKSQTKEVWSGMNGIGAIERPFIVLYNNKFIRYTYNELEHIVVVLTVIGGCERND